MVAVAFFVGWEYIVENVIIGFMAGTALELDPVFYLPITSEVQLLRAMTATAICLVKYLPSGGFVSSPVFPPLFWTSAVSPR